MKYYDLPTLFHDAKHQLKENYFSWAGMALLANVSTALLFTILSILLVLFSSKESYTLLEWKKASFETFLNFTFLPKNRGILFALAGGYFFSNKFFLTLVRNPKLVKSHFSQAVSYTFTDGIFRRIGYCLLYICMNGLLVGLALLIPLLDVWDTSVQWLMLVLVGIALVFIRIHLFPLPYIIQDTCSKDNLERPLSFLACLKKSLELMDRQKGQYFILVLVQSAMVFIYQFVQSFAILIFSIFVLSFIGPSQLVLILAWIIGGVSMLTIDLLFKVVEVLWANRLMEDDDEIVDFGD